MRKSGFFFLYIAALLVLSGLAVAHGTFQKKADANRLEQETRMVKALGITDLCLFTEASYTRHLSQADFHTAFQDSPMALEHFPSGSLAIPPSLIKRSHENLD